MVLLLAALGCCVGTTLVAAAAGGDCGQRAQACGGVTAEEGAGEFRGVITVAGHPEVLEAALHSGSQDCADCEWTLLPACPRNPATRATDTTMCGGAGEAPRCEAQGAVLFRLFLSTATTPPRQVDLLCLGGKEPTVVPVTQLAATDVANYLKDVHPPDLTMTIDPGSGVPAGLPTYFQVRPPAGLQPVPFGGGQVTETITIKPAEYDWAWGDGADSGWITDAGGRYPNGTLTHTYVHAGRITGTLTTRWSATYTIHVGGATLGPYDATGTVTHQQPFRTKVFAAHTSLVSHG